MSLPHVADTASREDPAQVVHSQKPDVFKALTDREIELAIWHRAVDPALAAWTEQLSDGPSPHGRFRAPVPVIADTLLALFDHKGVKRSEGALAFITDATDLARRFSAITGDRDVDVRVDHIQHDACWKFHRDCVPLRLICTYYGPGTEYVPLTQSDAALAAQRDYDGPLEHMPRYAVALFKGSKDSQNGIVHRSPPIADQGLSRLMLCLNSPTAFG